MTATPERIAADRARLSQLEAEFAANPNGTYVKENLASYRRRVAAYGSTLKAPVQTSTIQMAAIVAEPPAVARALSGTREDKLKRVATALGADEAALAEALSSDITPDAFALVLLEQTNVDAVAKRIASA